MGRIIMSQDVICPLCGKSELIRATETAKRPMSFGQVIIWTRVLHECKNCGENGEFTDETDVNYNRALGCYLNNCG